MHECSHAGVPIALEVPLNRLPMKGPGSVWEAVLATPRDVPAVSRHELQPLVASVAS